MTKESSRYIPSEIKRAVLFEAGHACAIPTCQFPAIEFALIVPYAKVKKYEISNIVCLCPNHHHLFDQKKQIDQKSMMMYKMNLQFLNKRYTKYEMRILNLLSDKEAVLVSGEIEVQGLLKDGLIFNAHTFETQSISISDNFTNQVIFNDIFVQSFAARLTPKGKEFIENWKSNAGDIIDIL